MSANAQKTLEELRAELEDLIHERGKEPVRRFLEEIIVRINRDERATAITALSISRCPRLATPNGLEYIRAVALKDLESLAPK